MCQLTMVDMKYKEFLPGNTLKWLLSMNSKEGHLDGIGCYLWDKDYLIKSKDEATPWLKEHFLTDIYPKSINGIFHVRRASVKTTKNEIKDYHAHPFEEGDLVLAHNGTLTPNGGINNKVISDTFLKLDKEDVIDSQKFLRVLNTVKGEKDLTPEIIKESMSYFYGSFAMIIFSKREKKTFVIRDAEKTLHYSLFTLDDVPVGIIINTRCYMLDVLTEVLCDIIKKPVVMSLEEVPKESISLYIPGSYTLEKVADISQSIKVFTPIVAHRGVSTADNVQRFPAQQSLPYFSSASIFSDIGRILATSKKIRLNLYDIFLLYELFFDSSILSADKEDLISFSYILDEIEVQSTINRVEKIDAIAKLFPMNDGLDFYLPFERLGGLLENYPPILNGKADLTKALEELEKKKGVTVQ